jgi:hypothetical protein
MAVGFFMHNDNNKDRPVGRRPGGTVPELPGLKTASQLPGCFVAASGRIRPAVPNPTSMQQMVRVGGKMPVDFQ